MKKYFIFPGGNPTILVDNQAMCIERNNYAMIAKKLLKSDSTCEQVGFIEKGRSGNFRCQMMGGEFCVNALRSLGLWIFEKFGETNFELESSGSRRNFSMQVEKWVSIALKKQYFKRSLEKNIDLVELEGISHFVQQINLDEWDELLFRKIFENLMIQYQALLKNVPAVGFILVDEKSKIYPLVCVVETQSLIFESACGSGTLAAFLSKDKLFNCFFQPSGFPYIVEEKEDYFILKSAVSFGKDFIDNF